MKIATAADIKPGQFVAIRAYDTSGKPLKDKEHLHLLQVLDVKETALKKHKFMSLTGQFVDESYSFDTAQESVDELLSTEPVLIFDRIDVDNYAEVDDIAEFTYGAIVAFDTESQQLVSDIEDCENCVFKVFGVRRQEEDQGLAIVQYVSNDGTDSEDCSLEYNRDEDTVLEVIHVE